MEEEWQLQLRNRQFVAIVPTGLCENRNVEGRRLRKPSGAWRFHDGVALINGAVANHTVPKGACDCQANVSQDGYLYAFPCDRCTSLCKPIFTDATVGTARSSDLLDGVHRHPCSAIHVSSFEQLPHSYVGLLVHCIGA